MNEKVEDWNGFSIHFVQFEGSWLWVADLEDICDALDLSADVVLNDIDRDYVSSYYDLCPECVKEFHEWFRKYGKEFNNL